MQTYIITPTDSPPFQFNGDYLAEFASSNARLPDRESSSRQWFTIDVYRTMAGNHVAVVHYRAGSRLGREMPVDTVTFEPSAESLFDSLDQIEGSSFVSGWPDNGDPASNRGRDFRRNDAQVRQHADDQYTEAINALADKLIGPEQPTVIP